MIEGVLAKVAASLTAKGITSALPDGNTGASDKAFAEIVDEVLLESSNTLRKTHESLTNVERLVLAEMLPHLRALADGFEQLRSQRRLEDASAVKVLGLLEEFVAEVRRTAG